MSVAILRFPGTNCDLDMGYAYEKLGAKVEYVWHSDTSLPQGVDLVVFAGGFSYGDYLRSGAIAKVANIMGAVRDFADKGGKVLGICNGFQILTEAGLLDGVLHRNKGLRFIAKNIELEVVSTQNDFLSSYKVGEKITLPIAHADGNYFINQEGLKRLQDNDQILLRYTYDVNGSVDRIAGICNKGKNIFGLMPHPERAIEYIVGGVDGLAMLGALL
ncbi:phosphoribosylformylglycinamidine synthase subunit PurQ [Helicobacter cholecystus]|uniref:Phosphoribosylformylglycinamidine synthase subunit PurQ n=1 Tax=Helicobacter cholecystus TaxID=45498 RepID=A0A3D8ITU3_9HELI|nr:phosphoribosylformylglycinamidine synthase subunit PurQ [Helicobacter cholecystus]RDU68632.1 phosphoribosylformylglycinamidine synthase subunit PurQ [Helicobacter cholecystus]VEJ24424.1 phosphoribosylformylglycinamidine synthase 1 [Helicobacter cholecystus]